MAGLLWPVSVLSWAEINSMTTWQSFRFVVMVLLGLVVLCYAAFEIGLAVPLPTSWYLPGLGMALLAALGAARLRGWRAGVSLGVAAAALLLVLHLVPWSPRKAFLAHFEKIEPGMDRTAVRRVMAPYAATAEDVEKRIYDARGRVEGDGPSRVDVYQHSRSGRFDSDFGIVIYAEGRVARTEFWPD